MGRLTKAEKDLVIDRAIADVITPKRNKLKDEYFKASLEAYKNMLTDDEWGIFNKCNKGWFQSRTRCGVYINGKYTSLLFKNAVSFPYNIGTFPADRLTDEINDKLSGLLQKQEELENNEKSLIRKLTSLLQPITTEKKLSEVWPDGVKYMTPCDSTENLPALTSKEVVEFMNKLKGE